jgi:uncharacterized membrane protein (UPF0127 family)/CheY-like chemotaxis protein
MSVALTLVREDGRVVSQRCVLADNPLARARGLMLRRRLAPGESIFIATSSIHTHFMLFSIDAVFVDANMTVIGVTHSLSPWRFARRKGSKGVFELEAGTCEKTGLEPGERLTLVDGAEHANANGNATRKIRVAIETRDRRFHRVASFLLSRNGFVVEADHDPDALNELIRRSAVDVVLLDASDSLLTAARTARMFEALAPDVGLVLAVNGDGPDNHHPGNLVTVPKWGSFDTVVDALERSFTETRLDGLA